MEQTASTSVARLLELSGVADDTVAQVRVLWGKSADKGDGHPSLLVTHLLDTAAVAEVLWDDFLAPATHSWIDRMTTGDGRRFFAWLCGIHDIGKATPAFQIKAPALAEAVRAAGLEIAPDPSHRLWHHTLAGGALLRGRIRAAGWSDTTVEWLPTMLTGHHGMVPQTPTKQTVARYAKSQGPFYVCQAGLGPVSAALRVR
jgi:CRISPR-associated endonuclease/helicase Cas3